MSGQVTQLTLDEIRAKIVVNLQSRKVNATLGGVPIQVQIRTLRNTLEDVAEMDEGENEAVGRAKRMMGFIYAPGTDDHIFDPNNAEHVDMFLNLRQSEEMLSLIHI